MDQAIDQGVGGEIKRLRSERDWSMARLAVEADMSVSGVSMIENGKRNLTTTTLAKLARAFGVEVADLFPKVEAPLWSDESPEGRAEVYEPWAEFVGVFAERWEQKIAEGTLDRGSINEFADVLGDLSPILGRLGLEEKREQPAEYPDTFGPVMGEAIERLMGLLTPLIEAGTKQVEDSDLARLQRRREQLGSEQKSAASG